MTAIPLWFTANKAICFLKEAQTSPGITLVDGLLKGEIHKYILRFPYRAQKDTSADFQQSIVTALQLLYSTVLNGKNDLMTDPKREHIQR